MVDGYLLHKNLILLIGLLKKCLILLLNSWLNFLYELRKVPFVRRPAIAFHNFGSCYLSLASCIYYLCLFVIGLTSLFHRYMLQCPCNICEHGYNGYIGSQLSLDDRSYCLLQGAD